MPPRATPRRSSLVLACLLASALPAAAVLRPPELDSQVDTLELLPDEARDFRLRRLAGHDLSDAGLFLALATVPLLYAVPFAADRLDQYVYLSDPLEAFYLMGFALLPAASSLMAAGNRVYAGAARYHPDRDLAITRSLLPIAALGLAAGKAFWFATRPRLDGRMDGMQLGVITAFCLTELYTIPALRGQFKSASYFLDQVHIRVTGQGPALGLSLEF